MFLVTCPDSLLLALEIQVSIDQVQALLGLLTWSDMSQHLRCLHRKLSLKHVPATVYIKPLSWESFALQQGRFVHVKVRVVSSLNRSRLWNFWINICPLREPSSYFKPTRRDGRNHRRLACNLYGLKFCIQYHLDCSSWYPQFHSSLDLGFLLFTLSPYS